MRKSVSEEEEENEGVKAPKHEEEKFVIKEEKKFGNKEEKKDERKIGDNTKLEVRKRIWGLRTMKRMRKWKWGVRMRRRLRNKDMVNADENWVRTRIWEVKMRGWVRIRT